MSATESPRRAAALQSSRADLRDRCRHDLSAIGGTLGVARDAVIHQMELARLAAVSAHAAGVSETTITRDLGVNRMTVRKWLGK